MNRSLRIEAVPGLYAVARLPADAAIPDWINGPGFQSVTRSDDELTLVCCQDRIPGHFEMERDWHCIRTVGPFPFDAAGVVASLIAPLSENGIGVFVICTFDGEHVLISARKAELAMDCLSAAGHSVTTWDI
ncbi:ACT domain-containing protein [Pontivivens insulae]|uniref:ACT domain-containing protein n=1 Tax=Pontivivens insulae TaxID=1639689 RepID=UPI000D556652|nr:ACT domain-containing protein [Pontivivens insulae]